MCCQVGLRASGAAPLASNSAARCTANGAPLQLATMAPQRSMPEARRRRPAERRSIRLSPLTRRADRFGQLRCRHMVETRPRTRTRKQVRRIPAVRRAWCGWARPSSPNPMVGPGRTEMWTPMLNGLIALGHRRPPPHFIAGAGGPVGLEDLVTVSETAGEAPDASPAPAPVRCGRPAGPSRRLVLSSRRAAGPRRRTALRTPPRCAPGRGAAPS